MAEPDKHDAAGFAAWLRKRAAENRRVAELPRDEWPYIPDVLRHLAFRFDQGASLIEVAETKRMQAEHEKDGAVQDVERLEGMLSDRVAELREISKDRDRLRKALNDAGDALRSEGCPKTARIIERALLAKPGDVPSEPGPCACDEPLRETCMCEHLRAGIHCRLTGRITTGSVSTRPAPNFSNKGE